MGGRGGILPRGPSPFGPNDVGGRGDTNNMSSVSISRLHGTGGQAVRRVHDSAYGGPGAQHTLARAQHRSASPMPMAATEMVTNRTAAVNAAPAAQTSGDGYGDGVKVLLFVAVAFLVARAIR